MKLYEVSVVIRGDLNLSCNAELKDTGFRRTLGLEELLAIKEMVVLIIRNWFGTRSIVKSLRGPLVICKFMCPLGRFCLGGVR